MVRMWLCNKSMDSTRFWLRVAALAVVIAAKRNFLYPGFTLKVSPSHRTAVRRWFLNVLPPPIGFLFGRFAALRLGAAQLIQVWDTNAYSRIDADLSEEGYRFLMNRKPFCSISLFISSQLLPPTTLIVTHYYQITFFSFLCLTSGSDVSELIVILHKMVGCYTAIATLKAREKGTQEFCSFNNISAVETQKPTTQLKLTSQHK